MGLIYAVRFLDENIAGGSTVSASELLGLATAIIDRGEATGRANGHSYLQWHGPNDIVGCGWGKATEAQG